MPRLSEEQLSLIGIVGPHGRARARAAKIGTEQLAQLFLALEKATKLFHSAPRRRRAGALAALRAYQHFVDGGEPIASLMREIAKAPAATPGDILHPYQPGQAIEANTRATVDRLKACCAYAAFSLSLDTATIKKLQLKGKPADYRHVACMDVAMVCLAYNFPRSEFYSKGGGKKIGPSWSKYAARIDDNITHFPTQKTSKTKGKDAAAYFRDLVRRPPFSIDKPAVFPKLMAEVTITQTAHRWTYDRRAFILDWLQDQFIAAGYKPDCALYLGV